MLPSAKQHTGVCVCVCACRHFLKHTMKLMMLALLPGPHVFKLTINVEAGFPQQMAHAEVQTDSFVPLNKVVAINCQTADTRPLLV